MATTRTLKSFARLLGAGLIAAPLAAAAGGHVHADTMPALSQLLPMQQGFSSYGHSVAVSGNTAVVGSIGDNAEGAAYVFVKTSSGWTEQARLTAPDAVTNALFGTSVAISGNTILVGDPAHTGVDCNGTPGQQTGTVYEFDRTGTTWKELATIGCGYAGDRLGESVALDGSTAVLGAPGYQSSTGAAWVFARIGPGDWQKQQLLLSGDGQQGDGFGTSVSINGTTALVGAPYATIVSKRFDSGVVNSFAGAAYVFVATGQPVKGGNAWAEQVKLQAPSATMGAAFGTSVSVSGDMALVGAPFDKNGAGNGKAYVYARNGSTWNDPTILQASDAASLDQFGTSVSLAAAPGQTPTALIGAYGAQAAYVFTLGNAKWTQVARLSQAGALGLGSAVATDGMTAVEAAIYGDNYLGAAFATTLALPSVSPPAPQPAPTDAIVNDTDMTIVYHGQGWAYYPGRPASFHDLDNDVHATLNNGDYASYTFNGTGISYISELSAGYGKVAVYIDGRRKAIVNADRAGVSNMGGQVLFRIGGLRKGRHTIKLVKKSGVYMLLDEFDVRLR